MEREINPALLSFFRCLWCRFSCDCAKKIKRRKKCPGQLINLILFPGERVQFFLSWWWTWLCCFDFSYTREMKAYIISVNIYRCGYNVVLNFSFGSKLVYHGCFLFFLTFESQVPNWTDWTDIYLCTIPYYTWFRKDTRVQSHLE